MRKVIVLLDIPTSAEADEGHRASVRQVLDYSEEAVRMLVLLDIEYSIHEVQNPSAE